MWNELRWVRWPAALALAMCCGTAVAAVSCEQLGQLALSTERLRDQGYSLAEVTAEADRLAASNKFSAEEIFGIRSAINDSFLRVRTSNEVLVECREKTKK